jgi:hypothetical protein
MVNVPDTESLRSMNIQRSFFGTAKCCPEKASEVFVKQKYDGVGEQARQLAETYIKWDNKQNGDLKDLCPQRGRVAFAHSLGDVSVSAIVEFNPDTRMPQKMLIESEDGNCKSETEWLTNGKIKSKTEQRLLPEHKEELEISLDENNGMIIYQEKYGTYE